jgi:hypothetical protein
LKLVDANLILEIDAVKDVLKKKDVGTTINEKR